MSPRLTEPDALHVACLAEVLGRLPPILVHRSTMTVVDGVHRLAAARLAGWTTIPVFFVEGSQDEAFALAVRANVSHGKPLTLPEREKAASRLMTHRPEWSNRRIAEICALSPTTVGRLRPTVQSGQLPSREGRDGKMRSTDSAAIRQELEDVVLTRPDITTTELASIVGTSRATARNVRRRMESRSGPPPASGGADSASAQEITPSHQPDLALASSPRGDAFIEWLEAHQIKASDWESLIDDLPVSRLFLLADQAREQARQWERLSSALDQHARRRSSPSQRRRSLESC
jgi:ParB-like chromosome segregation protein Spo0J